MDNKINKMTEITFNYYVDKMREAFHIAGQATAQKEDAAFLLDRAGDLFRAGDDAAAIAVRQAAREFAGRAEALSKVYEETYRRTLEDAIDSLKAAIFGDGEAHPMQSLLAGIIHQLESCKYTCEGGPLEMNTAFVELKKIAGAGRKEAENG